MNCHPEDVIGNAYLIWRLEGLGAVRGCQPKGG